MESVSSAMSPLLSEPNITGSCSVNPLILSPEELGSELILEDRIETPKVGMSFDSLDEASDYYRRFGKQEGFAVIRRTQKKRANGELSYITLACNRGGKANAKTSNLIKPRPQSKIDCPARISMVAQSEGKWKFNRIVLDHNHDHSLPNVKYLKCNRIVGDPIKRRLEQNDKIGINPNNTQDSLQIEVGGPSKFPVSSNDRKKYLDGHLRLQLQEGDVQAMQYYFRKMRNDNSDFFHAMDLDDHGQLLNIFWADARSRAAAREFDDVVLFDTTYLVNRYSMPLALFVGVNHHGQSILLGCGLISHEDTKSFSWLFETWKICMLGSAPKAIITDMSMSIKNAIEVVYPGARHRWCISHIMKKVPEKLSVYKAYKSISGCMRRVVYSSLTIEQFENDWEAFIKKYDLQDNTWLDGLYSERERWVPVYVKDIFWAGMSSRQRDEDVNAYFDGFVHSKTTIKQFVEQYENTMTYKVESERQEDVKSWNTFIPLIQEEDELEKQFKSVYTNSKAMEFHNEFVGKLKCVCEKTKEIGFMSEYEVKEWIIFGEGEDKMKEQVAFRVDFDAETNETRCTCRLFEFRGMVCRHQLFVWFQMGIQRVPDKYVLERWCKNVKRFYTRIRISRDNSSRSAESQRNGSMWKLFNEVADLAAKSSSKFNFVMAELRKLKQVLMEASGDSFSVGDVVSNTQLSKHT